MDFWATIRVLGRRWYIAVPILLLTIVGTTLTYASSPTQHVSRSLIVLTQPTFGTEGAPANPLLDFTYGLSEAATIVVRALNSPGVHQELGADPAAGLELVVNNGNTNPEAFVSAPFVSIEAFAPSTAQASVLNMRAADRAAAELVRIQRVLGADPATYVRFGQVVGPTLSVVPDTDGRRSLAASLALGVFLMLGATYGAESVLSARAARRTRAARMAAMASMIDQTEESGAPAIRGPSGSNSVPVAMDASDAAGPPSGPS